MKKKNIDIVNRGVKSSYITFISDIENEESMNLYSRLKKLGIIKSK